MPATSVQSCTVSHDDFNRLGTNQLQPWDGANLVGANSSPITVHGTVDTNLSFAGIDFLAKVVWWMVSQPKQYWNLTFSRLMSVLSAKRIFLNFHEMMSRYYWN